MIISHKNVVGLPLRKLSNNFSNYGVDPFFSNLAMRRYDSTMGRQTCRQNANNPIRIHDLATPRQKIRKKDPPRIIPSFKMIF